MDSKEKIFMNEKQSPESDENQKKLAAEKISKKDKIKALISESVNLKMEKEKFEKSLFEILDEE